MAPPKPQIILVAGAWHAPLYFAKITSLLQDHLYVVHAQQLPSVGVPPLWTPPEDLVQDCTVVRSLLDYAIGDGNDVIVICHSWGGAIAASALVGYDKEERARKGLKGGVIRVGYMCALMIDENTTLYDMTGRDPPAWYDRNGPYVKVNDPEVMYNGLSTDEQAYWFSQLQAHSVASLRTPTLGASWKTIPSSYLICEQDLALPVQVQEMMVSRAKEKGVNVEVSRLDTGHSPYLTMPRETVEWIRGVAGENM